MRNAILPFGNAASWATRQREVGFTQDHSRSRSGSSTDFACVARSSPRLRSTGPTRWRNDRHERQHHSPSAHHSSVLLLRPPRTNARTPHPAPPGTARPGPSTQTTAVAHATRETSVATPVGLRRSAGFDQSQIPLFISTYNLSPTMGNRHGEVDANLMLAPVSGVTSANEHGEPSCTTCAAHAPPSRPPPIVTHTVLDSHRLASSFPSAALIRNGSSGRWPPRWPNTFLGASGDDMASSPAPPRPWPPARCHWSPIQTVDQPPLLAGQVQRTRPIRLEYGPSCGMADQPGGFIHDQQDVVFIQDWKERFTRQESVLCAPRGTRDRCCAGGTGHSDRP